MNVWRMMLHHERAQEALAWSCTSGRIAIGWGDIGDLRDTSHNSIQDISARIREVYPGPLNNSGNGGRSLWNLVHEMRPGDLVILSGDGKRHCVVEVTGHYLWVGRHDALDDYQHQRSAVFLDDDPDELWRSVGGSVLKGQSPYCTLALCQAAGTEPDSKRRRYSEGTRFEILSSAAERDPQARRACIAHHGCSCAACAFDFGSTYGDIGEGFIHVHHLLPLSEKGARETDPIADLIPLCPNCHAVVHRQRPALSVGDLKALLNQ